MVYFRSHVTYPKRRVQRFGAGKSRLAPTNMMFVVNLKCLDFISAVTDVLLFLLAATKPWFWRPTILAAFSPVRSQPLGKFPLLRCVGTSVHAMRVLFEFA